MAIRQLDEEDPVYGTVVELNHVLAQLLGMDNELVDTGQAMPNEIPTAGLHMVMLAWRIQRQHPEWAQMLVQALPEAWQWSERYSTPIVEACPLALVTEQPREDVDG